MSAQVLTFKTDHQAWLEWRRQGIGGSDAAAICGLDSWRTPYTLWLEKTGQTSGTEESEAMRWGTLLEDVVADEFERRAELVVGDRQMLLTHPDHDWMRATIDGRIFEPLNPAIDLGLPYGASPLGLYEGKCSANEELWAAGVPERYQLQVQHNLAVTGLPRAWVAVLLKGHELRWFEVERDEEVISLLVEMEEAFWRRVTTRTPPPVDGSTATADALRKVFRVAEPVAVELPPAVAELVAERHAAHQLKKAAEERLQAAENALMAALGDAEAGSVDGRVVVTWKTYERSSLDSKALAIAHPDVVAQFTRTSTFRRFGFPSRKGDE